MAVAVSRTSDRSPQCGGPQVVLGALWIITAVLHIGLGVTIYHNWGENEFSASLYRPVWLGLLFMFFGVCCILTERHPRPTVFLLSGLLNLAGTCLSITAIKWYSYGLSRYRSWDYCSVHNDYWYNPNNTTLSPEQNALKQRCEESWALNGALSTSVSAILIILSVLDLCLGISSATLSFKALNPATSSSGIKPLMQDANGTVRAMPVAVSHCDAVLNLTSDLSSVCRFLCQRMCCPPRSTRLRVPLHRGGSQAVLGALWIITGILHIGLGSILLIAWGPDVYVLRNTGCSPVWLGVLFMFFGVCCILTDRHPRPKGVLLSRFLNLIGAALSIAAIVIYSWELSHPGFFFYCYLEGPSYRNNWNTPSPEQQALRKRCLEGMDLVWAFTASNIGALITLSVLGICLGLSSAIVSCKK